TWQKLFAEISPEALAKYGENYLAQGNTIAASNTLRAMASTPPKAPADAGKLARLLAESGELEIWAGRKLPEMKDVIDAAHALREQGIAHVVISL
ncbi:hypothetical protein, partial [Klebsiella pneumoniae]|uniref:hypothetical protein n=1 Tax=Klebsiella pneumoniae TaxID=573 RepID=UPI00210B1C3D